MCVSFHTTGQQVHNRWLLAYTLIRNPSLVPRKPADQLKEPKTFTPGPTSGSSGSHSSNSSHQSKDSNQILDCESPAAIIVHHPDVGNRASNTSDSAVVEDASGISVTSDQQHALVAIVRDDEVLIISEPVSCLTIDRCKEECEQTTTEIESTQPPIITKTEQAEMEPECPVSLLHDGKAEVEITNPERTWK